MQQKTKIDAANGRQDLVVTREFELPVDLLFRAYAEADIVEQWMGTKVLELENKKHGSYQFETTDPKGNKHRFNGTIHDFIPDRTIIRTFEMENTPFAVQLEFLEFEKLTDETSRLTMHIIYKSGEHRDQMLQMPFAQGINMAHNRLEQIVKQLK
jgi:uncharacterized protein YndB with AHSA1/START domain